jgi:excisionase family DNA binding protein
MAETRRPLIRGLDAHREYFPALSRQRFYEGIRTGLIPHVRVGRQVLLSPDLLERWIEEGGTALPGGWRKEPSA